VAIWTEEHQISLGLNVFGVSAALEYMMGFYASYVLMLGAVPAWPVLSHNLGHSCGSWSEPQEVHPWFCSHIFLLFFFTAPIFFQRPYLWSVSIMYRFLFALPSVNKLEWEDITAYLSQQSGVFTLFYSRLYKRRMYKFRRILDRFYWGVSFPRNFVWQGSSENTPPVKRPIGMRAQDYFVKRRLERTT